MRARADGGLRLGTVVCASHAAAETVPRSARPVAGLQDRPGPEKAAIHRSGCRSDQTCRRSEASHRGRHQRFERDREYGDECGNAKAIESLALEEYEAGLRAMGRTPDEIAQMRTRYRTTKAFRARMRVLQSHLSALRRQQRYCPPFSYFSNTFLTTKYRSPDHYARNTEA
jgi:hypothetical protein